ncbi:MAG: hypothetical protein ACI8RZ_005982 [Myxococcota bacterium]|jgi:hypothetical protein
MRFLPFLSLPFLSLLGAASPVPTLPELGWPMSEGTRWVFTDADGQEGLILTAEGDGRIAVRGPSVFWSGASMVLSEEGDDWTLPISTSYLGDDLNDPPWRILDLPLVTGKQWVTGRTEGDTCFTFQVTAIGPESITTPYGELDAWRVAYRLESHLGTERDFDAWFADGVGLVQLAQVASSTLGAKTPLDPPPVFSLAAIETVGVVTDIRPEPDSLTVTASVRSEGAVGEPLPVDFALVNVGPETFHVVPALDASDVGWRYPKIDVEIERVGFGAVVPEEMGRCKMMNPLTERDLRPLSPGESLNPFGPGTFGHSALRFTPAEPGEYRVRMVYDLGTPDDWTQAEPALHASLSTLPTGKHTSPWVSVTVR